MLPTSGAYWPVETGLSKLKYTCGTVNGPAPADGLKKSVPPGGGFRQLLRILMSLIVTGVVELPATVKNNPCLICYGRAWGWRSRLA